MESEPVQKSGTAPPESGKSVSPPHISLPGLEAALPVVAVEAQPAASAAQQRAGSSFFSMARFPQ